MPDDARPKNARAGNLLAAGALSVTDLLDAAARSAAGGSSAAAAIVRIGMHPGESIDFLKRALDLSHSATVRLVDRLMEEGLVTRTREGTADGRLVALRLTGAGEQALDDFLMQRANGVAPLLDVLTARERQQLARIMEKLLSQLANQRHVPHICRYCDYATCEASGCPVRPYLVDPTDSLNSE